MITTTFSGRFHGSHFTKLETLVPERLYKLSKARGLLCGNTRIFNKIAYSKHQLQNTADFKSVAPESIASTSPEYLLLKHTQHSYLRPNESRTLSSVLTNPPSDLTVLVSLYSNGNAEFAPLIRTFYYCITYFFDIQYKVLLRSLWKNHPEY